RIVLDLPVPVGSLQVGDQALRGGRLSIRVMRISGFYLRGRKDAAREYGNAQENDVPCDALHQTLPPNGGRRRKLSASGAPDSSLKPENPRVYHGPLGAWLLPTFSAYQRPRLVESPR